MEIKLIAADMDGTLLNDEKRVPEENLRALEECIRRGIHIVPATGRILGGLPAQVRALKGLRYAIMVNGAEVADMETGEILSACRLTPDLAVRVMKLARDSRNDIMYDAYVNGVGCTTFEFYDRIDQYISSPGLAEIVRKTRKPMEDNIAFIETEGAEVDKINMYFLHMEDKEQMRRQLKEIPGILVSSSIPNNLEINAAGADKGSALIGLAERLGILPEETMAFGDGENDLSMIRLAGIGVAMRNGEETVKAAADYVTDTNNAAGVAKAIDRFVFKKEML